MAGSKYEIIVSAAIARDQAGIDGLQKSLNTASKGITFIINRLALSNDAITGLRKQVKNALSGITIGGGQTSGGDLPITTTPSTRTPSTPRTPTSPRQVQSWTNEVGKAVVKTIQWAGAMTLVYGTLQQFEQGIQYIKDLNKEMTAIKILQVEGAKSTDEISALARSFNDLAIEMGVTTIEVAKGSVEWLRQGKTIAQTRDLLKATMILSKLGNIDSAQATEYLTSTLNGYNLSAEKSMSIVDKLVNLDNNYATSVAEISSALQRSANSANQAGVSLNELASYITIVSSTTRKSAESIGESFPR